MILLPISHKIKHVIKNSDLLHVVKTTGVKLGSDSYWIMYSTDKVSYIIISSGNSEKKRVGNEICIPKITFLAGISGVPDLVASGTPLSSPQLIITIYGDSLALPEVSPQFGSNNGN